MLNRIKQLSLLFGLLFLFFSDAASADDLRGYFPLYNGRFWNFTGSPDGTTSTWAVNGTLTLKDVGRVTLWPLITADSSACVRTGRESAYMGNIVLMSISFPISRCCFCPAL